MITQQLTIPYGDKEVLKSWLKGKYGRNFRIKSYKIGSFYILVPEHQLLCSEEINEIRLRMSETNHYVNTYDYPEE